MFRQVRYQTGEIDDIISEMKSGNIPCMDVDDMDEFNWFIGQLAGKGVYVVEDLPYDKNARDRVKEPEFEFRVAFSAKPAKKSEIDKDKLMYIDFYFEPTVEDTYDPVGEI